MLVDLNVRGKKVVIVGGGRESELKAAKLIDAGADVAILAKDFTPKLEKLASSKKLKLVETGDLSAHAERAIAESRPLVVFGATGDVALDTKIAEAARSHGAMVCVVDTPHLNDFNMPAIAKVGDIRVAVATGGMSPAVASIIRRRVEETITYEDVLQVKLQSYLRPALRTRWRDPRARRRFVYKILQDRNIRNLLRRKKLGEAKRLAIRMLLAEAG